MHQKVKKDGSLEEYEDFQDDILKYTVHLKNLAYIKIMFSCESLKYYQHHNSINYFKIRGQESSLSDASHPGTTGSSDWSG